jgi:hypothetical protein
VSKEPLGTIRCLSAGEPHLERSAVKACAIVGPIGFHGWNMATGSALVLRVWRTREKFRSYSVVHRTSGTERHRLRFAKVSASRGVGMSFQITILKVLAGHPEGRASLPDLKRAMAILITSGSDWTDRTRRLAARAPDLDIFSQSFVLRDNAGWQITDAGRAFLDFLQTPIQPTSDDRQAPDVTAIPILPPAASPITLIGVNRRRPLPRLAGRRRPSAAA